MPSQESPWRSPCAWPIGVDVDDAEGDGGPVNRAAAILAAPLLLGGCLSTTATEPQDPVSGPLTVAATPTTVAAPGSESEGPPVQVESPVPGSPSPPAGTEFTSPEYGYRLTLPSDWLATPATTSWDGGDIDHTADYADRFTTPEALPVFVLAGPAQGSLSEAVDAHLSWLSDARGCPEPTSTASVTLDGIPATRVAIHCPEGVFGPTLVSKAITVRDGRVIILTAFSPDQGGDDLPAFDALLSSLRWMP
jgi:hypothetical protein